MANAFLVSTFRTLGSDVSPHNLFSLTNGSTQVVAVRRLDAQVDSTALLATIMPQIKVSRPTVLPSIGTVLVPVSRHGGDTLDAAVSCRGATASDGGTATPIVSTAGPTLWQAFAMRLHTLVGQVLSPAIPLLPPNVAEDPLILWPGEALLIQGVGTVPATTHWIINCAFVHRYQSP